MADEIDDDDDDVDDDNNDEDSSRNRSESSEWIHKSQDLFTKAIASALNAGLSRL